MGQHKVRIRNEHSSRDTKREIPSMGQGDRGKNSKNVLRVSGEGLSTKVVRREVRIRVVGTG